MARGRVIDRTLAPSRTLTQQRDYRARKAARIVSGLFTFSACPWFLQQVSWYADPDPCMTPSIQRELEVENDILKAENERLNKELSLLRSEDASLIQAAKVGLVQTDLENALRNFRELARSLGVGIGAGAGAGVGVGVGVGLGVDIQDMGTTRTRMDGDGISRESSGMDGNFRKRGRDSSSYSQGYSGVDPDTSGLSLVTGLQVDAVKGNQVDFTITDQPLPPQKSRKTHLFSDSDIRSERLQSVSRCQHLSPSLIENVSSTATMSAEAVSSSASSSSSSDSQRTQIYTPPFDPTCCEGLFDCSSLLPSGHSHHHPPRDYGLDHGVDSERSARESSVIDLSIPEIRTDKKRPITLIEKGDDMIAVERRGDGNLKRSCHEHQGASSRHNNLPETGLYVSAASTPIDVAPTDTNKFELDEEKCCLGVLDCPV